MNAPVDEAQQHPGDGLPGSDADPVAELASLLRPSLLRLTRIIRFQRVDISITLTSLSALATLEKRGPLSAGDLALAERVQPPSMTKIIATLADHGFVTRENHPNDRRQSIIVLTEVGRELLDSERSSRDAWLSRQLATLDQADRDLLANVIPVLDKLADQ